MEIRITDPSLLSAVDAWTSLDGLSSCRCLICDENTAVDSELPLVVLFSSVGYLRSVKHQSLTRQKGDSYAAVRLPLNLGELSSAVRRMSLYPQTTPQSMYHDSGKPLPVLSENGHTVSYLGQVAVLSAREYALFAYLYEHAGRTVSRKELCENVWHGEVTTATNSVDVYISYLRRKLDALFGKGALLSVRGKGYTLRI